MQSASSSTYMLAPQPAHDPADAQRRSEFLPIVIIAVVAVLSRAIWFGDPAGEPDEQLYSLIGARMLHGALPYVDLWDRKPFGLFLLFAFAHALGADPARSPTSCSRPSSPRSAVGKSACWRAICPTAGRR